MSRPRHHRLVVPNIPAEMGARVRRARIEARLRQSDVAAQAGVSQSMVSRIELGKGGAASMSAWIAVSTAVGADLLDPVKPSPCTLAMWRRCHRLVTDLAVFGGWSWSSDVGSNETILVRAARQEAMVVRVWDVIANVKAAIDDFERRIYLEQRERGEAWRVGGAVVIPANGANRRRLTESESLLVGAFPGRGGAWLAALRGRSPMPAALGMIWTDQRTERLRPMLPYLDRRRRQRRR